MSKPKLPRGRERRLAGGEEDRLLDALSNPVMKSILGFALETALRRGELAAMRWRDLDLTRGLLHIPETKTGESRTIPLSKRAVGILKQLPRRLDGLVFGVRPDSITQAFNRACRRAGIDNLHFHDLRHEATSRLFERGLEMMEVASITGHQDPRMLKRYAHLSAVKLREKLG